MEATDGEIGKCEDVLFYDGRGHVAYFVVKTGKWFSHNQVLISPAGIDTEKARAQAPGKLESVPGNLTREKVESSPPYDSDKPVSDEYRERLALHYEWPYYVGDAGLWGPSVFSSEAPVGLDKTAPDPGEVEDKGNHTLRSVKEVLGYSVMSKEDAKIGHLTDVVLDPMLVALPYLRVREKGALLSRDLIVPWERIVEFSLASGSIRTTLDEVILENAPEAPEGEAFADSSVESAIRRYYQL